MKTKVFLIVAVGLLSGTLFSFTAIGPSYTRTSAAADTSNSKLFVYGEYVFNREKCSNCHSLNIADNESKISLDGLKGKYPVSWHYNHLIDPQSMMISSEMPSFSQLSESTFTKDSIEKHIGVIDERDWNQLKSDVNAIIKELNAYEINPKPNSDLIALVNYLDNIPESNENKLMRERASLIARREAEIRDSIWENSTDDIRNTMSKSESIAPGKILYNLNCTPCHGREGEGIIGPNLTDEYWLHGGKDQNIAYSIINGIPEKGMMAMKNKFTPKEIGQLTAYIKSIKGTNPNNAKIQQGTKE
jgi:mono/diheme cytochrome c family protein